MRAKRFIIVEGPDGAGKTTLSRLISERLGLDYHHHGPPSERGAFYDYMTFALHRSDVVVDRFHIGERVYGNVLRGVDTLGEEGQRIVESTLAHLYAVRVIIALPPFEVVEANWASRRGVELIQKSDTLWRIWLGYKRAYHRTRLPATMYDYTQPGAVERMMEYVY